jgi:hypothetical protein
MSKRGFGQVLATYILNFLLFTSLFILSFHTPLFMAEKVLFYRGLWILPIALILSGTISALISHYWYKLPVESFIASLLVAASLNICFFIVFPVTFDRSVTMYLLSELKTNPKAENCNGLIEKEFEQNLVSEYVYKQKAVSRRIFEQSEIGTIQTLGDCVQLSTKGEAFLEFSNLIKKAYAIDRN